MAGYRFFVSGEPVLALNTVYSALEGQGFKVAKKDEWSAHAERGSKAASIAFGALAGKSGRHVSLDISCHTTPEGNVAVTFDQGSLGISGGVIGMSQAKKLYTGIYDALREAFKNAGVLISESEL